jgi:hypothetical protein
MHCQPAIVMAAMIAVTGVRVAGEGVMVAMVVMAVMAVAEEGIEAVGEEDGGDAILLVITSCQTMETLARRFKVEWVWQAATCRYVI